MIHFNKPNPSMPNEFKNVYCSYRKIINDEAVCKYIGWCEFKHLNSCQAPEKDKVKHNKDK